MSKKAKSMKGAVVRVGEWLTDGEWAGRIIAVSGDDVAIEWEDGEVEQRKFESMATFSHVADAGRAD